MEASQVPAFLRKKKDEKKEMLPRVIAALHEMEEDYPSSVALVLKYINLLEEK